MAKRSKTIDRSAIARALGIPAPRTFVRALRLAHSSTTDPNSSRNFFEEPWSWLLVDQLVTSPFSCSVLQNESRYACTPAEVFPFATMGVDGVHYGFVVHDPSMRIPGADPHDWPIAQVSPMDFEDQCLYIGCTFKDALCRGVRQIPTRGMDEQTESRARLRAATVLNSLGLPVPARSARPVSFSISSRRAVVKTRSMLYADTLDGLGVVAEPSLFRNKKPPAQDHSLTSADRLKLANTDLREGFAASALVRLRDAWRDDWIQNDIATDMAALFVKVYRALGRDALANAVRLREEVRRKSNAR